MAAPPATAPKGVPAASARKLAGLPLWAWGAIIVGGALAIYLIRKRSQAASTDSSQLPADSSSTDTIPSQATDGSAGSGSAGGASGGGADFSYLMAELDSQNALVNSLATGAQTLAATAEEQLGALAVAELGLISTQAAQQSGGATVPTPASGGGYTATPIVYDPAQPTLTSPRQQVGAPADGGSTPVAQSEPVPAPAIDIMPANIDRGTGSVGPTPDNTPDFVEQYVAPPAPPNPYEGQQATSANPVGDYLPANVFTSDDLNDVFAGAGSSDPAVEAVGNQQDYGPTSADPVGDVALPADPFTSNDLNDVWSNDMNDNLASTGSGLGTTVTALESQQAQAALKGPTAVKATPNKTGVSANKKQGVISIH